MPIGGALFNSVLLTVSTSRLLEIDVVSFHSCCCVEELTKAKEQDGVIRCDFDYTAVITELRILE